ncbi:MAG: hypothetical protein AAF214_05395 [Pseudomonadota bacterium]
MKTLLIAALFTPICAYAGSDITLSATDNFNWETTPEGVAFAPHSGDWHSERYFAMVRLPSGTVSPPHTKSATMYGVILEGEMTHARPGTTSPAIIGAGGYYEVAASMPHISACVSARACVAMLYQYSAFDVLPVAS